jgi:immunoglobulin-like protein involved in spore germination/sporulation and spore germination protein
LLAALLIAGCGRERRSADDTPATQAPAPSDGLRALSIYFSDAGAERLVPVTRYLDPDSGLARGAVLALLAGPRPAEEARGLTSAVPPGSRLLGITVRDSIATVDLARVFESGGGATSVRVRLAQLVYTLSRVPGVRSVRVWLEGRRAETFSGEGLEILEGLTRSDFPDFAPYDEDPPVVLLEPVPGSLVREPVLVRGTANVFEAQVGLRVRDAGGSVVVQTWTTATCGTGCRGTFEKVLALPDMVRGEIVIEAYAPSAEDGSDMHRVATRVRLQ